MIGLVSPGERNVYEVCPSDISRYLQVRQFFRMGMSPRAGQGSRLSAHSHGYCMHFSMCITDNRVPNTGKYIE